MKYKTLDLSITNGVAHIKIPSSALAQNYYPEQHLQYSDC